MLHIHLLGGFRLDFAGKTLPDPATRRARSLLAYLALHQEQKHTRDRLAGVFCPDMPDRQARRRLSQALWQIMHVLKEATPDETYIRVERDAIWFDASAPHWLDVAELEGAWQEAREQKNAGTKAMARWEQAAGLYRGDFMAGSYDDWILVERERILLRYLDVLRALAVAFRREGQDEKALDYARLLVVQEPLDEDAQAQLMGLLHRLGQSHAALKQYEQMCIFLGRELGVGPSPHVTALFQEINDSLTRAADPSPPTLVSPSPLLEEGGELRMVGKRAERAYIIEMLERTESQGRGGLLLVEGEAGVGKSKLVAEIATEAVWQGFQVCKVRSTEQGRESYFPLFREFFRSVVTPLRQEQLQRTLADVWFRALAPLLPGADAESTEQIASEKQFRSAIGRALQALGKIKPHLLILEDLHWTDETTLELLAELAPALAESGVLIIGSFRGGEARESALLWTAFQALFLIGGVARIRLTPLDTEEVETLIGEALGLSGNTQRFARRIQQVTGGNPLFVLETLSNLYEEGLLYRDDSGAWATPWDEDDYARIPIPVQVYQVIARRFEVLSAEQWQVAEGAAVLGSDCEYPLLLKVSGLESATVLAAMQALIRRRLLREEEHGYRFAHDQIHEVAYRLIGKGKRRTLHRRAATALEGAHPQRVEALARHWDEAEAWEKSVRYHQLAGRRARQSYAGGAALAHFQKALAAWRLSGAEEEALKLEILVEQAEARQVVGPFDMAEEDFRQAWRLAQRLGELSTEARVLNQLSYLQFQQGDYAAALETGRAAQGAAERIAQSEERGLTLAGAFLNQANALRNSGRYETAIDFYTRAAAGFEKRHVQRQLADALNRLGGALQMVGRFVEAQAQLARALTIRRQIDDLMGVSYSLINLSALNFRMGDFGQSIHHCQEAEAIASAIADPYGRDAALANMGITYLEMGNFEKAQALMGKAIAIGQEIGDQPLVMELLGETGRLHLRRGRSEQAIDLLHQALAYPGGDTRYSIAFHTYLAEAFAKRKDAESAQHHARQALTLAEESKDQFHLGQAARVWAQLLAQTQGEDADVCAWFKKSIRILQGLPARAEWARSQEAYGRYLAGGADASARERGQQFRDQARELFRELEMKWDLAQSLAPAASPSQTQVWVQLPSARERCGRPLRDCEQVDVLWTLHNADDELIHARTARRRQIILRLAEEAREQNASPTLASLAQALAVSERTIKRDLAALRNQGRGVRLFGSR